MLDRNFLIQQADGDEALLGQIISLFLRESPALVAEMRVAIHSGAPDALHRAAHALTGSLGLLGAKEAISLVRLLSAKGRVGKIDGADELLSQLALVLEAVSNELIEIREECLPAASAGQCPFD